MTDTPIHEDLTADQVSGETPAPLGTDTPPHDPPAEAPAPETPAPDEQAPTPAGAPITEGVNVTEQQSAGVTTRDGLAKDAHPVTPEAMAQVKARRDNAGQVPTTTTDVGVTTA